MAVRKSYDVIFNGTPIFSGAYRSCMIVYEAILKVGSMSNIEPFDVVVAFRPVLR